MSLARFKASNHPQQTAKRGAADDVDDRGTEPEFIATLEERFGKFDLDVAAAPHNAKAARFYTREDDGLTQPWNGRVWCNPPYSDIRSWVEKAWSEWERPELWTVSCSLCGTPATFTLNRHVYGTEPLPLYAGRNYGPGASAGSVSRWHAKRHRARGEGDPEMDLVGHHPSRIVMLLPANRVEQAWWQDLVEPHRDKPGSPLRVEFLRGRMRFDRPGWEKPAKGDRPPFGCCLLIWSGR